MVTPPAIEDWPTTFLIDGERHQLPDPVVVEEPLEVHLAGPDGEGSARLAVTLRTPGHDAELVAGLLYAEGLIDGGGDLRALHPLPPVGGSSRCQVRLAAPPATAGAEAQARPFLSSAACGACGRGSLTALLGAAFPVLPAGPQLTAALLQALPDRMREAQAVFSRTGGLHAAALFDPAGELTLLREDVGRHNAVDKLVGALLLAGRLPAGERLLVVSGRAGFEIVQKALRAGLPLLAAVGAPSSMALRLASRGGMTLAGFVRADRCNVYCGAQRVVR